jgi:hypothetical protein
MKRLPEYPYQALGQKLRAARVRQKRTVAEASGAIEINEDTLKGIELGQERPAEDTLLVLISYLGIKEDEASQMWELAGYNQAEDEPAADINQSLAMIMPGDLRVVYTDMVHVMVNDFGVVMNFLQGAGPNNQPLAVARIGMSKEHAKSVLDILSKSLKQSAKRDNAKSTAKRTTKQAPRSTTQNKPETKDQK